MQPLNTKYTERRADSRVKRRPWLLALAGIPLLGGIFKAPLKHGAYVTARAAVILETRVKLSQWPSRQNAHFQVYYRPGQKAEAGLVLRALDQALPFEESNLDENPGQPLTVVVYASSQTMNRAVGEPPSADNIGYEYDGVIDLLSPSAWLGTSVAAFQAFLHQGPAAHELGHALLDLKADMNYPHWFNEGVAQYEDYRVTGYQWITANNALSGPLYSMAQLNGNFYTLANQSLAYREGLSLVEYLQGAKGHGTFIQFLNQLAQGTTFSQALAQDYHFSSPNALFKAWQKTLSNHATLKE